VLSSRGGTNFSGQAWRGFDIRSALEERLGLPVSYVNDANAAALYAHHAHFGPQSAARSSVSAIVGTGLGGGIVLDGGVVKGSAGMAGELGHIRIPLDGVLAPGQPMPVCNCGRAGDAESVASPSAIGRNLLPYWLTRFPRHRLAGVPLIEAARELRSLAEEQDPLALAIFSQQAGALGRLLTIVADVIDPDVYFIGGGVVEARPSFSEWFIARVEESIAVREEQSRSVKLVTDGDMAGARGAALTAWQASSSLNLW
jgi:glucokinase